MFNSFRKNYFYFNVSLFIIASFIDKCAGTNGYHCPVDSIIVNFVRDGYFTIQLSLSLIHIWMQVLQPLFGGAYCLWSYTAIA